MSAYKEKQIAVDNINRIKTEIEDLGLLLSLRKGELESWEDRLAEAEQDIKCEVQNDR